MRVDTDEQRPVDPLPLAIKTDSLRNGEHVRLVEAPVERRAAMSGGAEGHSLCRHRGIGPQTEVGSDQLRDIYQLRAFRGLSGQRTEMRAHLRHLRNAR